MSLSYILITLWSLVMKSLNFKANMKKQQALMPMGVSNWIEIGEKYGYMEYHLKNQAIEIEKEIKAKLLKEMQEPFEMLENMAELFISKEAKEEGVILLKKINHYKAQFL